MQPTLFPLSPVPLSPFPLSPFPLSPFPLSPLRLMRGEESPAAEPDVQRLALQSPFSGAALRHRQRTACGMHRALAAVTARPGPAHATQEMGLGMLLKAVAIGTNARCTSHAAVIG